MRMYPVITAVTAAAVIGGGVALAGEKCEQASEQFRKEHPDGYDAGCNSGEATLTVP